MHDDKTIRRDTVDLTESKETRKANLVVLAGQDIGRKYDVEGEEMFIGRNEICEIFIDDEDVSRTHAKIAATSEYVYIEDLGSTNGTLINGEKIKRHQLEDGDRIQVGNITVLKFNYVDEIEESFNEQLYNAANKDFLTQVYNKKYFIDRLKMEFSYSRRHGAPLSLMIFDIDFFKKINDTHGHLAGDALLKQFADIIEQTKRQEDLFARYGGEEFMLLLRDTDLETSISIAEKIRKKIATTTFHIEQNTVSMTVSIGVSVLVGEGCKTYKELIESADQQLYKAKEKGRNRVCYISDSKEPDLKVV
ncbi:MAG: diguanylate cyclase [Deltaproteobacteria bacterium]|nr:diguanylate cyclase [Deltaproteobacteria bacterium]